MELKSKQKPAAPSSLSAGINQLFGGRKGSQGETQEGMAPHGVLFIF